MKIAVSGATGLIGTALRAALERRGDEVVPIVRQSPPAGTRAIAWDPEAGTIDSAALEACDVVVTLAGEPLLGRWTQRKKRRIRDSRIGGTRLVSEAIADMARKPRVMLAASAIGYYGERGAQVLTEESPPGDGFLASVARDWEAATAPASQAGVRVANLRFAVALSPAGGALKAMLPVFRLGLGGRIGSGRQYFTWIALPDLVDAILHVLATDAVAGPVNVTAPEPVTNQVFTKALGRVLKRPAVLPVPVAALRLRFGVEAASAMTGVIAGGQRVLPARLLATGFAFQFPTIEPALRHLLAAPERGR